MLACEQRFQAVDPEDAHVLLIDFDQEVFVKPGKQAADGLEFEAQVAADFLARHAQVEVRRRVPAVGEGVRQLEQGGGETLIRALAQTPNAKLLMIGGQVGASDATNAAYLAKVKALIADLGLTDRVLWTDYTPPETVTANFLASDLCVLPYRDGASYRRGTLMAALAHGMAIVTTTPRVVGAKHSLWFANALPLPALRDGENCLLIPPDDPHALAAAIQRAATSPELRAKIGAGARQLAQYFTWDKIVQQHLELYERIANGG